MARKHATLRKIHTTSRLGLSASRGSEYSRLGSNRKSRTGSTPLRFFWITPSLVPTLPSHRGGRGEDGREGAEQQNKRKVWRKGPDGWIDQRMVETKMWATSSQKYDDD